MLIRLEILIFFISIGYTLFYIFDIFYSSRKSKQLQKNKRLEKRKEILQKHQDAMKDDASKNTGNSLSAGDMETLREILKRVQVNKARGYYETARNLIVEGLAIDKGNRDLNLELGEVYELEEKYKNAEYIYKDMLKIQPDSIELLKKLGNILILQGQLQKSTKVYESAFDKKRDDIDIVDILASVYFELKNFKKCLKYTKLYLKDKPRDVEKLGMKGYCLEKEGSHVASIGCYEKILEIQPYNMEIKDRIKKLEQKSNGR